MKTAIFIKTWQMFCDIDGTGLKETLPYPLGTQSHRGISDWDQLSCRDRLNQIKDNLTNEEIGFLEAVILQMGGGPLESMAFTDSMRWYALGGWTPTGMNDIALTTRLRSGQSTLARRIFDHAVSTGRLAYAFNSTVQNILEEDGIVSIILRSGKVFRARQVICTIPLNVLSDISFSPPISALRRQAFSIGQVNLNNKIHADVAGDDLVSWTSFASPGKGMICGLSDQVTPSGDTHLVLFGPKADSNVGIFLNAGIQGIKEAVEHLLPPNSNALTRIVSPFRMDFNTPKMSTLTFGRFTTTGTQTSFPRAPGATMNPTSPQTILRFCGKVMGESILQVLTGLMVGVGG
jgi:Flavin containing amine oxidoreductase